MVVAQSVAFADLRTGGPCFDLRLGQYFFRGLMVVIATGLIFLIAVRCCKPVAWKEYCLEYWLKELKESMDRCTGRCGITEILSKTALNTMQAINELCLLAFRCCLLRALPGWLSGESVGLITW